MLVGITIISKWKTGVIFKTYKLQGVFSTFIDGVHTETTIEFDLPKDEYDFLSVGSLIEASNRSVVDNFSVNNIDLPNCREIYTEVI